MDNIATPWRPRKGDPFTIAIALAETLRLPWPLVRRLLAAKLRARGLA